MHEYRNVKAVFVFNKYCVASLKSSYAATACAVKESNFVAYLHNRLVLFRFLFFHTMNHTPEANVHTIPVM